MPRGDCKAGGLFIVSFWDRQVPACSCAVFCFLRRTLVAPSACREHFQRKQHRLKTCGGPGNHKFSISVNIDLSFFSISRGKASHIFSRRVLESPVSMPDIVFSLNKTLQGQHSHPWFRKILFRFPIVELSLYKG